MLPMLEAGHDRIDLWLAHSDEIKDPSLLARYRQLLTEEELRQERRFHFSKDQHRYLITRALVRTVLSAYVALPPEQWRFTANAYGKPAIADIHPDAQCLSFNLSHTQGLVVLGITKATALGIDTENTVSRRAPLDVASHFFSASEVAALNELDTCDRNQRFFQYWTLKEAYIKARGMGLSIPLNQFSFHLPAMPTDSPASISFQPELNDAPERWRFWQIRASASHLIAICAERPAALCQQLNIHKVVPLVSRTAMTCEATFEFMNP